MSREQSVPLVFRDKATASPFRDQPMESKTDVVNDHIHLEGFLAGWGCCCLQVTFQAQSLTECLRLHDQLLPLTGIMVRPVHSVLAKRS